MKHYAVARPTKRLSGQADLEQRLDRDADPAEAADRLWSYQNADMRFDY